MVRPQLPILECRGDIVDSIRRNPVTIVAGETGSGKTTQLPLMCLEAGLGRDRRVGCTQPRRIAAVSLADYVAKLLDSTPGEMVGYKVRFKDRLHETARVKFMTDGILLAEIAGDPLLTQYDALIVDEAHERTVNIDFLLGYLRTVLPRRPDLRLIISSATIDTGLFSRVFNHASVIEISGRLYPIETIYKPVIELWQGESIDGYVEGVVSSVREIVETGQEGDVLVFLPTIQDIHETVLRLRRSGAAGDSAVLPLHSRLATSEQHRVFDRSKTRKIVVATNIAETSLTVPGIRFVIDSGLARTLRYEPSARITRMPIERISRASADQRRGRCGRVRDGVCIRLFSEPDYSSRPAFVSPEIKRANLAGVILRMAYLRLGDPEKFPFLQRPSADALREGFRQLRELGAIDRKGSLTGLGRNMGRFPLDPPVARMLIDARGHGAVEEVAVIAAALSVEDPRLHPADAPDRSIGSPNRFRHPESDFLTFVEVWKALHASGHRHLSPSGVRSFCTSNGLSFLRVREWIDAHDQIVRICARIPGFTANHSASRAEASFEVVHKSLLGGLVGNIAAYQGNHLYTGVSAREIMIFPASTIFRKEPAWVLFHEIIETNRVYGRTAAAIRPEWVEQIFSRQCRYDYHDAHYDEESGTVRCREEVTYQGLTLIMNRRVDLASKDHARAHEIFVREALVGERAGDRYRFIAHNRAIRASIESAQRKLRNNSLYAGDWALESFYDERLGGAASLRELHELVRVRGGDDFLMAGYDELLAAPIPASVADYPDALTVAGHHLNVRYALAPGEDDDGATVEIPSGLFDAVPGYYWEWLLTVYVRERTAILIDVLTDEITAAGRDAGEVRAVVQERMGVSDGPFLVSLCRKVREIAGIDVEPREVPPTLFPEHLRPRIRVVDERGVVLLAARTPLGLERTRQNHGMADRIWADYCSEWETGDIGGWREGRLPGSVFVQAPGQAVPIEGYPAMVIEDDRVAVRTFFSRWVAAQAHERAVGLLTERALAEDLAWKLDELKVAPGLRERLRWVAPALEPHDLVSELFHRRITELDGDLPRSYRDLQVHLSEVRVRLQYAGHDTLRLLQDIVNEYATCHDLLSKLKSRNAGALFDGIAEELSGDLESYLGWLTDTKVPTMWLDALPQFLRGLQRRIENGFLDPGKYRIRMLPIRGFAARLEAIGSDPRSHTLPIRQYYHKAITLLEEFQIAQFASQQLKARERVTPEVLERAITAAESAVACYGV